MICEYTTGATTGATAKPLPKVIKAPLKSSNDIKDNSDFKNMQIIEEGWREKQNVGN